MNDINDMGSYRSLMRDLNNENSTMVVRREEVNMNKEEEELFVQNENSIEYLECCSKKSYEDDCLKSSYQGEIKPNIIGSNSILIIEVEFSSGDMIKQITDSIFTLEARGIYQVSINVKVHLNEEGSIVVYPRVNGIVRKELSSLGNNNLTDLCAQASNTFLIDAMQESLYLDFLVNTDECTAIVQGSICIVKIV